MSDRSRGSVSIIIIILIIIAGAFYLSGGLFSYKFTNPDTNGAFIPLSSSPQNSNKTLQFRDFPFLFLTPTPTPQNSAVPAECAKILNNTTSPVGPVTQCQGKVISLGVQKKLIPILPWPGSGRPGTCVIPPYIVMHTTDSNDVTAETVYEYFNGGAGGRGAATQFAIGKKGDIIQMTETLDKQVEVAYGVGNFGNTIGIELTQAGIYHSRSEAPVAQYNAALCLVKALMKQYNIPLGQNDYTFVSPDIYNHPYPKGIYGHYQLNPIVRTDPGAGF